MDFLLQCLGHRPRTTTAIQLEEDDDTARAAASLVDTIFLSEKTGSELKQTLAAIISTNSWRQNFAKAVFESMQRAIETARPMGEALRDVYEKAASAVEGVEGFVRDHPVVCALVALGMLVLLAPWVVEALGFAEGGILEGEQWRFLCMCGGDVVGSFVLICGSGSFAAEWQAAYAGFVPKGSLFALLQRLGMKGFI
jgi:hypothetical protein